MFVSDPGGVGAVPEVIPLLVQRGVEGGGTCPWQLFCDNIAPVLVILAGSYLAPPPLPFGRPASCRILRKNSKGKIYDIETV